VKAKPHETFCGSARKAHFPAEPRDGTRSTSVLVLGSALQLEAFVQQLSPKRRLHVINVFELFQTYLY